MVTIAGYEFDHKDVDKLTTPTRDGLVLILAELNQYGAVQIYLDDSPESYEFREFFGSDSSQEHLSVVSTDGSDMEDAHHLIISNTASPNIQWMNGL